MIFIDINAEYVCKILNMSLSSFFIGSFQIKSGSFEGDQKLSGQESEDCFGLQNLYFIIAAKEICRCGVQCCLGRAGSNHQQNSL
jgi:hypothetical protein